MCTGYSKKPVGGPRNEDKVFVRVVTTKVSVEKGSCIFQLQNEKKQQEN